MGATIAPMIVMPEAHDQHQPNQRYQPGEERKRLGKIRDRDITGLDPARHQIQRMKDRADRRAQPRRSHRTRPDARSRDEAARDRIADSAPAEEKG